MVRLTPRFKDRTEDVIQSDMARHLAWHISSAGKAVPKPIHIKAHLVIIGSLLIHGGYGQIISQLWFVLFIIAFYCVWLAAPVYLDGPNRLVGLFLTLFYVPIVCFSFALMAVGAVPKIGTLFAKQDIRIEAPLCRVYKSSRRRRGLSRFLLGQPKPYVFDFAGQPAIEDYRAGSDFGFQVGHSSNYTGAPIPAIVSGPSNWFGIRVQEVSKPDLYEDARNSGVYSSDPTRRNWLEENCLPAFI